MIVLVRGSERSVQQRLTDSMFRIRARVFDERLGWDVKTLNGLEVDIFDDYNPLYLISVDEKTGLARGSLRLLPTTGPNMLRDVFHILLPEQETVESPTIWESSRFSIDPEADTAHIGRLSSVTTELLCGIVEVGLQVGLSFVVSVFDARMIRIFRAANCPADLIGTPKRIGRVMTYAGLFEISETTRQRIAMAGGIVGSVLAPSPYSNKSAA